MVLPHSNKTITYAEYLTWTDERYCEALNGEIISMAPAPSPRHQDVVGGVYAAFRAHLKGATSKPFIAPIDVCLFAESNTPEQNIKDWVQPDLIIVCNPHIIGDKRIIGCPDFIAEVTSPSTFKNDRVRKFQAYAQAGVKEYWIIDPYHEFVETFILRGTVLERSGQYFLGDSVPCSLFSGFRLDLTELFGPAAQTEQLPEA
ncbi:Uma2 family endonuclease [Paenibacillus chartarius]|uniref:Uma2 family endonuclease n=1 Tax=Paenibacillus chartarius TaxID=747481 RepID=A0ABV6DLA0_9BACL